MFRQITIFLSDLEPDPVLFSMLDPDPGPYSETGSNSTSTGSATHANINTEMGKKHIYGSLN
jgi:hypothetical protein